MTSGTPKASAQSRKGSSVGSGNATASARPAVAGAATALRSALTRAPDPGLAKLAAFRLARVLIAQGELDAAAKVIQEHDDGGAFSADFAGLRGDIALAQGRPDEARSAYRKAVDGGAALARIIELKLQDLPPADPS